MIERGATHIGVATDHVVESFRNDLYPGYKTSEGVPQEFALAAQRDTSSRRADCPCLHLCFSAYINSLAYELALVLFDGKTH